MRLRRGSNPGLTDRLIVGRNVTSTFIKESELEIELARASSASGRQKMISQWTMIVVQQSTVSELEISVFWDIE
jgi:hypothetical protein